MSFEPASPINVVVCEHCQGKGCDACDRLGIYGLRDDQPVGFYLPDFIDLPARKFLQKVFLLKRVVLLTTALIILSLLYAAFGR